MNTNATYYTHTTSHQPYATSCCTEKSPLWAEIIMVILWIAIIPSLSIVGALLGY